MSHCWRGISAIRWCSKRERVIRFLITVEYGTGEDEPARTADIVVPRQYGIVRHFGE